MVGGESERPLGELDWEEVAHAPVGIALGVVVGFDSDDGGYGFGGVVGL